MGSRFLFITLLLALATSLCCLQPLGVRAACKTLYKGPSIDLVEVSYSIAYDDQWGDDVLHCQVYVQYQGVGVSGYAMIGFAQNYSSGGVDPGKSWVVAGWLGNQVHEYVIGKDGQLHQAPQEQFLLGSAITVQEPNTLMVSFKRRARKRYSGDIVFSKDNPRFGVFVAYNNDHLPSSRTDFTWPPPADYRMQYDSFNMYESADMSDAGQCPNKEPPVKLEDTFPKMSPLAVQPPLPQSSSDDDGSGSGGSSESAGHTAAPAVSGMVLYALTALLLVASSLAMFFS